VGGADHGPLGTYFLNAAQQELAEAACLFTTLVFGEKLVLLGFRRLGGRHRSKSISTVYDRHGYGQEDQRIMEAVASHIERLVSGVSAGNVVQAPFTAQR
jgi:hypothetical protein